MLELALAVAVLSGPIIESFVEPRSKADLGFQRLAIDNSRRAMNDSCTAICYRYGLHETQRGCALTFGAAAGSSLNLFG